MPDPGPPPFERNGHVTFASVNDWTEVSETATDTWAAILRAGPNAHIKAVAHGRAAVLAPPSGTASPAIASMCCRSCRWRRSSRPFARSMLRWTRFRPAGERRRCARSGRACRWSSSAAIPARSDDASHDAQHRCRRVRGLDAFRVRQDRVIVRTATRRTHANSIGKTGAAPWRPERRAIRGAREVETARREVWRSCCANPPAAP